MILRDLFTETPYAAALHDEFLRNRCSTCFADEASTSCQTCEAVVYCDENCRDGDKSLHENECVAFQESKSDNIDQFCRLLGRILTRRLIDRGVVHLCDDFPKNVPDRCLSNLMSHQSDFEGSRDRLNDMNKALDEFRRAFAYTPTTDDWELVRQMYCVMWINCFLVSGPPCIEKGQDGTLGLGFYLNTSRYNHSCKPDLQIDFIGSRLLVQYPSDAVDEKALVDERLSMTQSADKFDRLTISYGFSTVNDSYFPTRRQRRDSLMTGYYFWCRCVLCDDEREAQLEENAASIECAQCSEPYVWKKKNRSPTSCCLPIFEKKFACEKSCSCISDKKEMAKVDSYVAERNPEKELSRLDKAWSRAMTLPVQKMYADEIVDACKSVLVKAQIFWHRNKNLRLSQLNERLFVSYGVVVMADWKNNKDNLDAGELKMALKTGEAVVDLKNKQSANSYQSAMAAYAYEMGRLTKVAAEVAESSKDAVEKWNRAADYFSYAATIWRAQGDKAAAFVSKLEAKAEDAKSSAADLES